MLPLLLSSLIEFDFRPEDYRTRERWSALSEFFQSIVDTIRKPAAVTYENVVDDIIETFEPRASNMGHRH